MSPLETKTQAIENSKQLAADLQQEDLQTPWQMKKQQIRKDYNVSGNIILSSSSINEFAGSGVEDGSGTRHVDKYDKRLANLERREMSADEKVEISQKEYENHVEHLFRDLQSAWSREERVQTLKIAIQIAKLLSDTTLPQFYPSIFVIVTDALDRFGDMVFKRLLGRAEDSLNAAHPGAKQRLRLPADFKAADVPSLAKETTRNWFYKTACIRELLPRIYVEIALLRCYRFVTDTDYPVIFQRIGSVIRGLGDPLVAFYARLYLVVSAGQLSAFVPRPLASSSSSSSSSLSSSSASTPTTNSIALPMLQDALFSLSMARDSPLLAAELEKKKIQPKQYFYLLSPAIEWMLKVVGRGASRETFQSVLQLFRDTCDDTLVLRHIIEAFDASHYAHAALGMVTLAKGASVTCVGIMEVLAALGKQLAIHPPPEDQRLPLLNEVWKTVTKELKDKAESLLTAGGSNNSLLGNFITVTAAWLDCVQRHYSEREMLVLLGSLAQKLKALGQDVPDNIQQQLESLFTSLIGQSNTFGASIFTSEHILSLLDVLKGTRKTQLCRDILHSLRYQPITRDPVLINTLFDLARVVHDSVDGLAAFDDVQYSGNLLCSFMTRIDFGRDVEQQLNFYVECRAAFPNFDAVKDRCVTSVAALASKAFAMVKGRHTKKTSVFVKACLAYCHITIPSLQDLLRRFELLLYCAQVSLLNACLPQTDTFLKAAISLLPEISTQMILLHNLTSSSNGGGGSGGMGSSGGVGSSNNPAHIAAERLSELLLQLLGFLVIVPGHPEHGPFYVVQGLLNALPQCPLWGLSTLTNINSNNNGGSSPTTGAMNGNNTQYATIALMLRVYVQIVTLLATLKQRRLPYHIHNVQSNDELYGNTPAYDVALQDLLTTTVADILGHLTKLGERSDVAAKLLQAKVSIDLANVFLGHIDLSPSTGNNPQQQPQQQQSPPPPGSATRPGETLQFVLKLLDLAHKQRAAMARPELRYLHATAQSLQRRLEKHRIGDLSVPDSELLVPEIVDIASRKVQEYAK
jgi:hypothetical protein